MTGILLISCQNNNYTIKGAIEGDGYEATNVYLQKMTEDAMVTTDTATVVNGEFTFTGVADSADLRFILLDESVNPKQENRVPVLLEPGKITVTVDSTITVSGTKTNSAYNGFKVDQRVLINQIKSVVERFNKARNEGTLTDELEAEVKEEYDNISGQLTELNYSFLKNNMNNQLGQYVFLTSYSMFESDQQKELIGLSDINFKENARIKRISKRLESLENVAIGKEYVDFTLKDTEGNEVSLSDYVGKGDYVLIDFWAAWCGPCRQEMPNVVAAYEKYKSKGFQVVGVSFDREYDDWTSGIKELNMTWPQMSDLLYWDSPVVELYAIQGIPHTVLLDGEGVIIGKDIRGSALDEKLSELMP